MAQQPPPGSFPAYNYMQQPQHQNGNQQQVNGFPQTANLPPMKPMQAPSQQLPPQQAINYQNFQTKALQPGVGLNGSNSALSSRTSSPGVQQNQIPQSQLPPSRSYPSYQQMHQQQPGLVPPSSQLPPAGAPINNNNIGDTKTNFAPLKASTPNIPPAMPVGGHPGAPMASQPGPAPMQNQLGPAPMQNHQQPQQPLSSSMKNLSLNPGVAGGLTSPMAAPQIPQSKSEQNFLNNNGAHGLATNPSMPQMPPKPSNINAPRRPAYPQYTAQSPTAAPGQFQQPQQPPQVFNNFPGGPVNPQAQMNQQPQMNSQPQMNQQPQQPRGNLQYQNFPQQQQQQQQQFPHPGSIVQQGFSRMWGNETCDLMQHRHILPPTKVLPPPIKLNHQFHEATNCSTDIFRCTLTKIPESNSLLQKSRLPLGILIHPYRDLSVSFYGNSKRASKFKFFSRFRRTCRSSVARQSSAAESAGLTSIRSFSS